MKKDYLPVSDAAAGEAEAAFTEAYWTRIWQGRELSEVARADIERRDEFRVMNRYLGRLPAGSRLLDGGCGLGEWTLYYASRGFQVVGLDISRATVARLQARFPDHKFVVGDVRQTGFEDASFDGYFSWGTFEHFEEGLGPCLEEARRVLRPGGLLCISVPFQNARHVRRDRQPLWAWDESFSRTHGYTSSMRFYQWRLTKPELQRELELHGFRTLRIEPIHKPDGLHRALQHDLGVTGRLAQRVLLRLLRPIVPASYVAHMVMGVGAKR